MPILNMLASQLGRKDEEPNIELAHQLANSEDAEGIKEIIENLSNKEKKIRHDCIKVAYEIGKVRPELTASFAPDFIGLLKSHDNRLVWGGMTALSVIADRSAENIMENLDTVKQAILAGSVITVDKGILTLAKTAAASEQNRQSIFPFLLSHLETCRPKEIPQHAESTLHAVNDANKAEFVNVLREREAYLSPPQLKRVRKIYQTIEAG
ncbi:hypothetical protein GKZ89_15145 [Bacillus mangrovi]|uniref:HEAT repeat domain-containing protein n=1 Tax=Metabacillus mangrovi TaxID=1491830 RepID=A0A7X2S6V5_9BACI|nr:hypothetical protein [Metabacillus mangrovi]MTH54738.1 hypothetical protein [Metabacillus mangrovi]